MYIEKLVENQRHYFSTGKTLPIDERITALKKLRIAIIKYEEAIIRALFSDLGKCREEAYMCEIGTTLSELNYMLKNIKRWSAPHRVLTPLAQFHAKSFYVRNPYGVVLIISPWNYPFMLTMEPLIGAIACGNCCIVKPSAYSQETSAVIKVIIEECFDSNYVAVIEGGRRENKELLKQPFDYIFFTGSVSVGKEVMRSAAESLIPVTLELGGKSPCIVDGTAKVDLAAKRIAFGKLLNCGQTCVAPDYVLIDKKIEKDFIERLKFHFAKMAGDNPLDNNNYPHMINHKHFSRVMGLIDKSKVVCGGHGDERSLRIEPTVMKDVKAEDRVMQEEIFGPLLPVISFDKFDEAVQFVKGGHNPLACYLFTEDKTVIRKFTDSILFGGGCINDTIIHLATSRMGFGGVGMSGMGSYHGKKSYETFSHEKSIVKKYTWMDLPIRYAPYSELKEKFLRVFLR